MKILVVRAGTADGMPRRYGRRDSSPLRMRVVFVQLAREMEDGFQNDASVFMEGSDREPQALSEGGGRPPICRVSKSSQSCHRIWASVLEQACTGTSKPGSQTPAKVVRSVTPQPGFPKRRCVPYLRAWPDQARGPKSAAGTGTLLGSSRWRNDRSPQGLNGESCLAFSKTGSRNLVQRWTVTVVHRARPWSW